MDDNTNAETEPRIVFDNVFPLNHATGQRMFLAHRLVGESITRIQTYLTRWFNNGNISQLEYNQATAAMQAWHNRRPFGAGLLQTKRIQSSFLGQGITKNKNRIG